tara:strand:+ start:189 stop:344 length:156 start_codon:yes stop_codon:yes gene_type:complete
MANIIEIGHVQDTGKGKILNTGSMRRSYNTKKKNKRVKDFRVSNNKYVEGK